MLMARYITKRTAYVKSIIVRKVVKMAAVLVLTWMRYV